MRGNITKKRKIIFAFEKTLFISLICKLVPVQYREYEYGQLGTALMTSNSQKMVSPISTPPIGTVG